MDNYSYLKSNVKKTNITKYNYKYQPVHTQKNKKINHTTKNQIIITLNHNLTF